MTNITIEKEDDIENICEHLKTSYQKMASTYSDSIDEDDNETGEAHDETDGDIIIDGIPFKSILETIPRKYRGEASKYYHAHGIIATLSSCILPRWDQTQRHEAVRQVLGGEARDAGIYSDILIKLFKVDEHIEYSRNHKRFIEKTFYRFKTVFKHLQEKSILVHDDSKFSFIEIVGYTDKWTWGRSTPLWEEALAHHYENNSHHPQHCLLEQMTPADMEESVVDMMACHWERKEGGGEEVPAVRIVGFSDFYLDRYLPQDRIIASKILQAVRDSGL